jgi:hypothetical protein
MKRILISMFVIALLAGCTQPNDEAESVAKEAAPVKERTKQQEEFSPEAFLKEAENHSYEWYVAEASKLTPEQIEELEKFQAEQEAIDIETYQKMVDAAETKESVDEEGQKVIEYTMVNILGRDVEWFQLQWVEGGNENVSEASETVKDGEAFTLIVNPAFDKTLDDIDLSSLKLTGS